MKIAISLIISNVCKIMQKVSKSGQQMEAQFTHRKLNNKVYLNAFRLLLFCIYEVELILS